MQGILDRLKYKQTRQSTTDNYLSIWKHFNKFVIKLDCRDNISWEEKTALFGAYLVDDGVQSSTLKSYFSAIKYILKQDGYEWDDNKAILSSLIKSCKIENDTLKVRLPIQKGLFEMLLFELERLYGSGNQQPYLELMYKVIFCLAYYGMMRVGELTWSPHTLKASNVHISGNKDKIMLVLYTSKTHGTESSPQRIKISAVQESKAYKCKRLFCSVKAVTRFMTVRGNYDNTNDQFFVFVDGSPVKPKNFRATLRELLNRLGLNALLYDVHSFRIGRTCDLAKFGYSIEQIKSFGRWKSNAVYTYLKNWITISS